MLRIAYRTPFDEPMNPTPAIGRIFQDGSNTEPTQFSEWLTSRMFDDSEVPRAGTWHWPPRT